MHNIRRIQYKWILTLVPFIYLYQRHNQLEYIAENKQIVFWIARRFTFHIRGSDTWLPQLLSSYISILQWLWLASLFSHFNVHIFCEIAKVRLIDIILHRYLWLFYDTKLFELYLCNCVFSLDQMISNKPCFSRL